MNSTVAYVFIPMPNSFKLAITVINTLTGFYGLVANSLILYFTHKRSLSSRQSFDRQPLTDRFIQSLALSDVLCSLISTSLFTAELFVDFVKTTLACKVFRYVQIYLPVTTVVNYLVIGIERYLSVFYPFRVPSIKIGKRLVIAAWFVSATFDLIPVVSYNLVRFELSNTTYTRTCKYDNSAKLKRVAFMTFTLVTWALPCILLVILNIRIFRYLQRQKRRVRDNSQLPTVSQARRYRTNRLIVSLIFAFVIPYLFYFFYGAFVMIFKIQMSFEVDYIARYICTVFIFANGAIGSTILFLHSSYHKQRLFRMCRRIFRIKRQNVIQPG